jgi:hypothetical protein
MLHAGNVLAEIGQFLAIFVANQLLLTYKFYRLEISC